MNRVGLTASYRNLTAQVGDFTPRLSTYSLNGTTLRGGLVEYTPRNLIFTLTAGQARRSVDARLGATIRRPAFNRNLFAARAGIGAEDDTHFHLIGTLARDVGVPETDAFTDAESISATTLSPSTRTALPAENLTLTPAFGLLLLDRRLFVEGQATASAFTRDTRAAKDGGGSLPDLPGLYTPRVGSRLDYAGLLQARYTLDAFPDVLSVLDQMVVRAFS
jgi:hypothetical protein